MKSMSTEREIRLIEEDDGWWSAIDEKAGVASQGASRKEALENLDEAVEFTEEARDDDTPAPEPDHPGSRANGFSRDFSGREIVRVLKTLGYRHDRTRGDHAILKYTHLETGETRTVTCLCPRGRVTDGVRSDAMIPAVLAVGVGLINRCLSRGDHPEYYEIVGFDPETDTVYAGVLSDEYVGNDEDEREALAISSSHRLEVTASEDDAGGQAMGVTAVAGMLEAADRRVERVLRHRL